MNAKLATIITELEREVAQVERATYPALLGELERLKAVAWAKVISPPALQACHQVASTPDRYLTVPEVVARFSVTSTWLYRHKRQMPHSQPSRKVLLFPEQAITKWFACRKWT
ncbi:hypothetical protein AYO43_03130 [Nitrospira sp. SCGC AG-212-E16]|nr:hypothetical protein AYO43_03130 [Nitrospira sp. SCGC AG-212-E16]